MPTSDDATTRRRTATLKDVALLADVSIATASKALNGRDNVHPDTRRRVVEAAERVSFTPNRLARTVAPQRTGTIGLLAHDLEARASTLIIMGAEDAASARQVAVVLCDARGDSTRERHHLTVLLSQRVDGLLVIGSRTDPRPSLGRDLPVPVVYAYAPSLDPADCSVVPNSTGSGALAVEHLLAGGRRRIAHVSGDADALVARERADGAVRALADAGFPLAGGRVLYGSWTESWGRSAAHTLMDSDPQIDAILCGSDHIARGVLEALRDRAIDVPRTVAVMGFDNCPVLVGGARPPLTSVDTDLEVLGGRAAYRLLGPGASGGHPGVERLDCRVAVRESTAYGH